MSKSVPSSSTTPTLQAKLAALAVVAAAPISITVLYEGPSTLKSNDDSAKDVDLGATELDTSSPSKPEYYAYDIRTDVIFKFRRMNKYVLLQTIPLGAFMKISLEDFDEYFEGTPEPLGPLILRIR